MKHYYFGILIIALASLASAQNKNAANPALRPYHNNGVKPVAPAHKTSGDLSARRKPIGNAAPVPAKNVNDAQVTALEHKQATVHNAKPAAKNVTPAAKANANKTADANQPIDFKYKAPNSRNTPVGGQANGRATH
jgi:hypothetical protein